MNTGSEIEIAIVTGMVGGSVALLFFFIKSYFTALMTQISELKGAIEVMRRDLHDSREAIVQARSELKAVWRTLDGPQRASDGRNLNGR